MEPPVAWAAVGLEAGALLGAATGAAAEGGAVLGVVLVAAGCGPAAVAFAPKFLGAPPQAASAREHARSRETGRSCFISSSLGSIDTLSNEENA